MAESLSLASTISEDTLHGTFPFIKSGTRHVNRPLRRMVDPPADSLAPLGVPRRPFPIDLFTDLTKREIQNVLEILHYAVQASTGDDVYHVLQLMQKTVACPKVIGGVVQLNGRGGFKEFNSVINVSYSNDWLYTYGKQGYAEVDPVLQCVLSTFKTQTWQTTYKHTTSRKQCEFVEEARANGLTHGITTGMLERSHRYATFFSFAGGEPGHAERYTGLIEYLLPHLHRVLAANCHTPLSNRVKGLSPREVSVLMWIAQGKTNWEISRILGVTERTVRFHVEGIFGKLNVSSRTQAVAFAVKEGMVPTQ